jgi:hypothetical protein
MNYRLKEYLKNKIQQFIEENCEACDWPEIIIGKDTVMYMTEAAANVFDGILESQIYGIKAGYFKEG